MQTKEEQLKKVRKQISEAEALLMSLREQESLLEQPVKRLTDEEILERYQNVIADAKILIAEANKIDVSPPTFTYLGSFEQHRANIKRVSELRNTAMTMCFDAIKNVLPRRLQPSDILAEVSNVLELEPPIVLRFYKTRFN